MIKYSTFDKIDVLLKIMTNNFYKKKIDISNSNLQKRFLNSFMMEFCQRKYSDLSEIKEEAQKTYKIYTPLNLLEFFTDENVYQMLIKNDIDVILPKKYALKNIIQNTSIKYSNIIKIYKNCPESVFIEQTKNWTNNELSVNSNNNWWVIRHADGLTNPLFFEAVDDSDMITPYENMIKSIYHDLTGADYFDVRPCKYSYWIEHPEVRYSTR